MSTPELTDAALEVATLLAERQMKLVLAESCTAGLAAAALGRIPGISNWFCGSAVVYRTETKFAWLGVDPRKFDPPEMDGVGPQTSAALAKALLERTPEADVAAAITGHLGPNAPGRLDGRSFASILPRPGDRNDPQASGRHAQLRTLSASNSKDDRTVRQSEAATFLLRQTALLLREGSRPHPAIS